jgi:hypothetical protein
MQNLNSNCLLNLELIEKKYTELKDALIKEIVQKSEFSGLTMVQANLPAEWQAYEKILQG